MTLVVALRISKPARIRRHDVGMSEYVDKYRKTADDCRAEAIKALHPDDKKRWLDLAQDWLLLAESREERLPKKIPRA